MFESKSTKRGKPVENGATVVNNNKATAKRENCSPGASTTVSDMQLHKCTSLLLFSAKAI